MNKKAESMTSLIMAGVAILIALVVLGVIKVPSLGGGTTTTTTTTGGGGAVTGCTDSSVTMTIGPLQDKYNSATSMSTIYSRVFIDDQDMGLKADSTTMNVGPGNKVDIYYAENATGSTNYYARKVPTFNAPCTAFITAAKDAGTNKLVKNGTITFRIYNHNDGNTNAVTDNMSLVSADTKCNKMEIVIGSETAVSPEGQMYLVYTANDTSYKKVYPTDGFESTSCPEQSAAKSDFTYDARWCYKSNTAAGYWESNKVHTTQLCIETESGAGNEPTNNGFFPIVQRVFDEDWYQNTKDGKMYYGVETNEQADVGMGVYAETNVTVS